MSDSGFQFDEIGEWSVLKLEIIEKYGSAYTKAFNIRGRRLKKYYIDGFSGAGLHVTKKTRRQVEGSPARALAITPHFDGYYFIDLDRDKVGYLRMQCEGRPNVHIVNEDANAYLRELLPTIQFSEYRRALCVLDPYGLHLDWDVIRLAGQSGAVDMFLNFPVMDMNRNAIWRVPERAGAEGIARMTRFWGDESWKQAAYVPSKQSDLFSAPGLEKQPNSAIVAAFRERLNEVAGFRFVPEPIPMKNKRGAPIYYLFFASPKPVAKSIIEGIFAQARRPKRDT